MALTVITRPQAIVLGDCIAATIDEDYAGKATVNTTTPHGLSSGDYVYVRSNVENYNGFWTISVVDGFHFFLLQYPGGNEVVYIVDAAITYCPQESLHTWNAVHLPIVYELESDTFPTNNVSTPRTVSSFSDENGYVNLNLSGSLGTFEELSFVEISGTSELDGVYQIFNKVSNSDITINLVYSGSLSFAGGTITIYFSNYHVLVEVWAGIKSGHAWESLKPYEKAATLKLIPDADNRIKFSINEILKSYITTVNNTLLASLPNNTDFWTNFYIKYAEAYDESNGYTITTTEEAMTSDLATFEGFAANAELEFKNQYSGQLSEYIMTHAAAKFLTLFTVPVLFGCSDDAPDCYQDISFITNLAEGAPLTLRKTYYIDGTQQSTVDESITNTGPGLYRVPLSAECSYDRVDIKLITDEKSMAALDTFLNNGFGTIWTTGPTPFNTIGAFGVTRELYGAFTSINETTLNYAITAQRAGQLVINILDENFSLIDQFGAYSLAIGVNEASVIIDIDPAQPPTYIALQINNSSGSSNLVQVNEFTMDDQTPGELSETKTFKIDCGCSSEEIRLTWLNNLGGFDYWKFTAFKDHIREIKEAGETRVNILPSWPKSYGSDASTIRKQTFRTSGEQFLVRSQHVTLAELQAIAYIKSAVLVQEIVSRSDRRTVIVDEDSFTIFKEDDKLYQISFTITRTNNLPSQRT